MSLTHRGLVEDYLKNTELVWDSKHSHIEEIQSLIGSEGRAFISTDNQLIHILFNDNCKGDIHITNGTLDWIEQDRMEGITNNEPLIQTELPTENPSTNEVHYEEPEYIYEKPDKDYVGEQPLKG
jgi:hypothetical protein